MNTGEVDLNALLNSSDREVRIAARRQRIQARIAAKREGDGDGKQPFWTPAQNKP